MTDESNSCSFSVWFRWYTVMLFLPGGGLVRTLLQALWLAGLWVTWSCCESRDSEESYTWNSTMFNVTVTCLDWWAFLCLREKKVGQEPARHWCGESVSLWKLAACVTNVFRAVPQCHNASRWKCSFVHLLKIPLLLWNSSALLLLLSPKK